jgi:hypothetical protein
VSPFTMRAVSDSAEVRSQSLLAGTALRPTPDASGGPRPHAPARSEPASSTAPLESAGSRVAAGQESRRLPDWPLIVVPAVTLAVMLWGIGARSYWGDEADTVGCGSSSDNRFWGEHGIVSDSGVNMA